MKAIDRRAISAPSLSQIPRRQVINGVEIRLLYPPDGFLERSGMDPWRDPNNNGLVLKMAMGEAAFLITGDIKAPAEAELVQSAGTDLAAAVMVAPHHGSKTSSTPAFVEAVRPKVTVASVGWRNRYHFPHPSVVHRLEQVGSRVLRTDIDGAVHMATDGRCLRVTPFLSPVVEMELNR
jgi:competence protein ComEC